MSSIKNEIMKLEELLRLAELGPDPNFFEKYLADDAVLVGEDGHSLMAKSKIVEAHRSSKVKFVDVVMGNVKIVEYGDAAVVTYTGKYNTKKDTFTLKFMRVWLKRDEEWQIIAGTVSK